MTTSKNSNKSVNGIEKKDVLGDNRQPPQFVQYRLTDEELAEAKQHLLTPDGVITEISALCENGYKMSVSVDKYGGGLSAFLTPTSPDNENFGFTLSARAPSFIQAFSLLVWKHYELFSQDWPKEQRQSKGNSWG